MRVILLRYIRFSCSARLSRAPGSEWARLPRPEAAFLGGPARGSQNRNGAEGKAEASQAPGAARAPKPCRDKMRNRKRPETVSTSLVVHGQVAGQGENASSGRSRRIHAKRWEQADVPARPYAACRHVYRWWRPPRHVLRSQTGIDNRPWLDRMPTGCVFAQRVVDTVRLVGGDVLADDTTKVFLRSSREAFANEER